jgi:3-hydroxybutyryl-CoA dehydrogenase
MMRPMSARDFTTVGVIGLGTMGAGIAEVFARNGYQVVGVEQTEETLKRGRQHVEHSTGRAVKRGKLTEEQQEELVGRITFTTSMADVKDCGLVVEAVVEQLPVKQQIFRALDDVVGPDAVLATNTSSLSVTEISTATSHPGRVIGVHFFNPAPVQALVEIIRTVVTEPDVLEDAAELARSLQKTPVVVGDKAGFIANALLFGYLNHAASMFEGHYATREDLDAAMRFGCGYPMGPLALLDLIGLDTAYEILDTMYKQGRDRLHAPGIVEVFAKAGFPVTYVGRTQGKVDAVRAAIEKSLDKAIQRGKLEESAREEVLGRLHGSTSLDDLATVDIVVEAIAEDLKVKSVLFQNLDDICKPGAILATTTSSLPVIALAKETHRAHDVVGMHFFNPAPIMKLVEVVSTVSTADDVAETTRALCEKVGKVAVSCGDRAGFIVNALLFPYLNDAVKMLEAHYATADDIDTAMKYGCALPMGPFELLDVVGNDVSLAIQRELYLEFREPGFAPAPLLEHLVTAGYLGRKTQKGFRDYTVR